MSPPLFFIGKLRSSNVGGLRPVHRRPSAFALKRLLSTPKYVPFGNGAHNMLSLSRYFVRGEVSSKQVARAVRAGAMSESGTFGGSALALLANFSRSIL
jgi:hypothetical protein